MFNVGQLINEHRALKDKCAYYGAQHDKEMAENAQHRGHIAQLEGKNKELTKKLQAQMQSGQLLELKLRGHDESIAKQYKLQMQFDKQQERLMKIESDNAELEKLLYKHEIPVPDTINKHRPRVSAHTSSSAATTCARMHLDPFSHVLLCAVRPLCLARAACSRIVSSATRRAMERLLRISRRLRVPPA